MSRSLRLFNCLITVLLLLVVVALGSLYGLLASDAGTRLLARQVQARAGDTVQWTQLTGSVLGPLQLAGLQLSLPGLQLAADQLQLSWQPRALLAGRIHVEALRGTGIRLTLTTAESAPAEGSFNPADIALPLALALDDLSFSDLQLIQPEQPPVQIDSVTLSAQLVKQQLEVRQLALRLPQGGIGLKADTELAERMPIDLELSWDWLPGVAEDPATRSSGSSSAPPSGTPLTGEFTLAGLVQWGERIDFELAYRLTAAGIQALSNDLPEQIAASGTVAGLQDADQLILHRASLELAGAPLSLLLSGSLADLSAADPSIAGTLEWRALQWPLQAAQAELASEQGSLGIEGRLSDYRLDLSTRLAGRDVPPVDWTMAASGDLSQLAIKRCSGQLLGGELAITGELQWDPAIRWDLQLSGRDLNPAQWQPGLPGSLALELTSTGAADPVTGVQADLVLQDISGRLLDYPLLGSARIGIAGESLQIDSLALASGDNRWSATGEIGRQALAIDWQLDVANPGSLIEGAAGELAARGHLKGSPSAPRLQLRVSGRQLAWADYSVPSLTLLAAAGAGADEPLEIALDAPGVLIGGQQVLDALQLQVAGTTARHRLQGAAARGEEQLQVHLDGGLDLSSSSWLGRLSRLALDATDYGQWALAEPALLSLAGNQSSLGASCLQASNGSGRLCLQGHWRAAGDSGLDGSLHDLPLARFVPGITGTVDGQLSASLASGGELRLDSELTLGAGEVKLADQRQLAHGGGQLRLQVAETGLLASLNLDAPEQGRLQATVGLPALVGLPMAEQQPVTGTVQAVLPDLSGLAAWVPHVGSSAGHLSADLQLGGNLTEPKVEGSIVLRDAAASLPVAGLELDNIELELSSLVDHPGQLALVGGIRSGEGRVALNGAIDLAGSTAELSLDGDRFQVYDTPDARALLSPELQLAWRDDTLTLRGQLTIPEAAITPKIQLSPATSGPDTGAQGRPGQVIAPSADVVVISETLAVQGERQAPAAPFRIDSRLRVLMGDDVRVNAVGFVSRITGSVDFSNRPEQEDLIPLANGRFSLREGTFRAFGQDLEIEAGHLIFANVPATEPELNLRAVRWIDNDPQVTAAGVLVTGPLSQPALDLFSRPQLETSEIQSYLLTGRSPRSRNNVLSIGTYLSRRIYVGYGYNMLEKTSEFNSLFNISPRFGAGGTVGEADNNINMTFTYEH